MVGFVTRESGDLGELRAAKTAGAGVAACWWGTLNPHSQYSERDATARTIKVKHAQIRRACRAQGVSPEDSGP